ncbi:hypothetical protein JQC92_02325 [Shewanella sp. 202IG2-18]|uniref:hypothetical protein n=1 Tax=Parashewanella hymeniacidonis TaxID=2807618 RepID=UPI00195FA45B|nr:hypothetical protein [Parashewanella hymeniacidonis]MBM7070877.1 hypothetical protein [Parashewanella hymeniacidonis]
MSAKISITYIGEKPVKKDTITGSRLVFQKDKPVEVVEDIAYRLLDYPKVWVTTESAKDVISARIKKAKELEKRKAEEAEKLKQEIINNSVFAIIDGVNTDITKFNSNQLATLEEAHDLVIDNDSKKPVAKYRAAVRDELAKLADSGEE